MQCPAPTSQWIPEVALPRMWPHPSMPNKGMVHLQWATAMKTTTGTTTAMGITAMDTITRMAHMQSTTSARAICVHTHTHTRVRGWVYVLSSMVSDEVCVCLEWDVV
eukprot:comp13050_c0_seq1/m.8326 comp13050_c0_seq1/g.8326  ORF comp13050_c0_seq1/g.8326 comp13050_c0_seq1/m.8326 type:complete len:107 (-) comp13050_c0_seq1:418-738(-)